MAKRKFVDKAVKSKILDFNKLLRKSAIPVDQIILYGSHAKGKAAPKSDIDLCVVSPIFKKNTDSYFKKIWHLAAKIDPSLEPIPFTAEELANKYSTLSWEINTHGIRIV